MSEFQIKDSGKRQEFTSGMVRDTAEDKVDFTLITDGPMFRRWALHLTNGAKKYAKRNWMKAQGEAEYERFRESAFRHFMQWFYGDEDEDHASAVYFNINGAEYLKTQKGPLGKLLEDTRLFEGEGRAKIQPCVLEAGHSGPCVFEGKQ